MLQDNLVSSELESFDSKDALMKAWIICYAQGLWHFNFPLPSSVNQS